MKPQAGSRPRSSKGIRGQRPFHLASRVGLGLTALLLALAGWVAGGDAASEPPAPGGTDSTWVKQANGYSAELIRIGYPFRGAQWALALAGATGGRDRRALDLIQSLPPGSLSNEELLVLGEEATRRGRGTGIALLALARHAARDRRPATHSLLAAARALGADSAAAVAIGAGWPRPQPLKPHTIGVLCPLTGRGAGRGEAFVRGAQLAIEDHNPTARIPLAIATGDTRGEAIAGGRAAVDLCAAGVGALIADAASESAVPAATAAAAAGVPLVSTALEDALGKVGPGVYTLSVPLDAQVRALARAATRDLGWKRLAILAPENPAGAAVSKHFSAVAIPLGGEVVGRETYRPGETNFARQLEAIAPHKPDAVFIPGAPRELLAAIPQLSYYEVGSRVLGLEELGQRAVLAAVREYLDPGVFTHGMYGLVGAQGQSFAERFTRRYRSPADADATRGYMAARMVADAYALNGGSTRESIRSALDRRAGTTTPGSTALVPGEDLARVPVYVVSGKQDPKLLEPPR
jgi:branched-chain amino acid transport system substrate-binding protein